MAKGDKKNKEEPKAEEKSKKSEAPEFKYGVSDLADMLDIKPASVRVGLRNKGIEKAGKSYGWNTQAELKEVAAQLKTEAKKEKGKKGKKEEPAPEPEAKKDKKDKKDKKNKKAKTEG